MQLASYSSEVSYSDEHHRPVVAMVMHHELSHSWFHRFSGGIEEQNKSSLSLPARCSAAIVPDVPEIETA